MRREEIREAITSGASRATIVQRIVRWCLIPGNVNPPACPKHAAIAQTQVVLKVDMWTATALVGEFMVR
jgi:hypothetical protein